MTPFEFPDEVRNQLDHSEPGEWVPVPQQDGTVYYVCAAIPVLDDEYVRREVNKGLDSTDTNGSKPLDKKQFKERAREWYKSQSK